MNVSHHGRWNEKAFGYGTYARQNRDLLRTLVNTVLKLVINLLTPRSRVLLEKLTVTELLKKSPAFYGTRSLIIYLKEPETGPYSELDASSHIFLRRFYKIHSNIVFRVVSSVQDFRPKFCMHFSSFP
jgi:hypothetical protein